MAGRQKSSFGVALIGVLLIGFLSGCGTVKAGITTTGTVEMAEVNLSSKVAGKIINLPVLEGQVVTSGTLLAELDHEEIDAQIMAARSTLEVARARYQNANTAMNLAGSNNSTREAQIQLAGENLAVAKANLEQAEQDFNRAQRLYQEQVISQSEYEQAQTRKKVAGAQFRAAQSQLELARAGANADDIDLSTKVTRSQITQAEANLSLLETQLRNTRIYAPANGVISGRLVEPGENVSPGMNLFTLLDTKRPWVKIYLPLKETEQVKLNQRASVSIDAFPGRQFKGRIAFISQEAEFTPKNYLTKEERVKQVFAVKIELDNSSGLLKAGIPVDVIINKHK